MILYLEKPKYSIKYLLDLVNEFSEWQGTKTIYKKVAFLYTGNELTEKEMKKAIPFTVATKISN
jgi:hypothetical protein